MKKKVILYTAGGFVALIAGVFAYSKIVQWKERKGKKVIEEGSFTIIVDEAAQGSQLTSNVTDSELSTIPSIDTEFTFEPFNF